MKKTYINPNIEVVRMNIHQQMLSGSPGLGTQYTGGTPEGRDNDGDDW